MKKNEPFIPPAIAKRSQARLLAMQAVYAEEMTRGSSDEETDVDELIDKLVEIYQESQEKKTKSSEPDRIYLKRLIEGVFANRSALDSQITKHLKEGWALEKMDGVLRAVLRCALYEMIYDAKAPPKVIINEYVDVAHAYFNEKEVGFVNAILDRISQQIG